MGISSKRGASEKTQEIRTFYSAKYNARKSLSHSFLWKAIFRGRIRFEWKHEKSDLAGGGLEWITFVW